MCFCTSNTPNVCSLCFRPQYFKIIEECVSQIVLHRSGTDPDFSYRKRLDVDFSHLLGVCVCYFLLFMMILCL